MGLLCLIDCADLRHLQLWFLQAYQRSVQRPVWQCKTAFHSVCGSLQRPQCYIESHTFRKGARALGQLESFQQQHARRLVTTLCRSGGSNRHSCTAATCQALQPVKLTDSLDPNITAQVTSTRQLLTLKQPALLTCCIVQLQIRTSCNHTLQEPTTL